MLFLLLSPTSSVEAPEDVRRTAAYREAAIVRCPSPGPEDFQGVLELGASSPWESSFFQSAEGFIYFAVPTPTGRAGYWEKGEEAGFVEWLDAQPGSVTECTASDLEAMRPSGNPLDDFDCSGMEVRFCEEFDQNDITSLPQERQELILRLSEECGCTSHSTD